MFEEAARERFRQKALLLAAEMNYSPDLVNEAVATLDHVFGANWVNKKANEPTRGLPLPLLKHPIGSMIHTAGEAQIIEALELVEYLKRFAGSSAFRTVIHGLISQFRSTRLQIAFAYRIGRFVSESPELEPRAAGGRVGDIGFELDGFRYIVECYAPGKRSRELDEIQWLTSQVMKIVEAGKSTYSVAIALKIIPNAADRKTLVQTVRKLVERVDPAEWLGHGYPPSELDEGKLAVVSVAKTRVSAFGHPAFLAIHPDFPKLGDPHQFVAAKRVPVSKVKALISDTLSDPYHDHIAVWHPDFRDLTGVVDDTMLALVPKIREKLSQAKAAKTLRVMIVDTWTAGAQFQLSNSAEAEVRRSIFENHSDVAGVLMVARKFDEDLKRHRYEFRAFANLEFDDNVVGRLIDEEGELLVPPRSV